MPPESAYRHGARKIPPEQHSMVGAVLRDADVHPETGELFQRRAGEAIATMRNVLALGVAGQKRAQAMLDLALDVYTSRRLARNGLSPAHAAEDAIGAGVNGADALTSTHRCRLSLTTVTWRFS